MSRAMIVLNSDSDRERASRWARQVTWGTRIEFKAPKRTDDQNALMWVLLTKVAQQASHMGKKYTPDEWKILFMHACGREVQFLPALDERTFIPWGQSSSDLSKQEMTDLIEFIYSWGAEHGLSLDKPSDAPPPSDAADDSHSVEGQGSGASSPADAAPEPSGDEPDQPETDATQPKTAKPADPQPGASVSEVLSDEDLTWLKTSARMLWQATGVGEQELLGATFSGLRNDFTPATISDKAKDRIKSIKEKCKLVCFGERTAADVLPQICMNACCSEKDLM